MSAARHINQVVLIVAVSLLCLHPSFSQSTTVSPVQVGVVTEKVVIPSHPDQSYAVYLPTNYTPDHSWPIVFCLDPRARGKTAIEHFVVGGEKYGYVVVCSNNSRNGLNWPLISDIFSNFWDDAHSRFNIDVKRTYAAGFSGGSRLASTFASKCQGCLAGVIGCGAGFPGEIEPNPKAPFAYFGIVGVDDFNFGEMWQLEKKFNNLTTPYHFETFSGGHEWPPRENIEQALAWLRLREIKPSTTTVDKNFLEDQLKLRLTTAEKLLASQQFVDAQRAFVSVVQDFQGLIDTADAKKKAEQLSKSGELKKAVVADEELYRRQLREAGEIRMLWMKPAEPDDTGLSHSEVTSRLSELKKKRDLTTDSRDRRLARRILTQLTIESYEAAQASLRSSDYSPALVNLQLVEEIDPKSPNVSYEVARVYALKRQKKPALQSLEKAVSLGFKDGSRLKTDDAFNSLTDEPRFQKLLTTLTAQ